MKELLIVGLLMAILCGCSDTKSLETVSDVSVQPPVAEEMEIMVNLPEEAAREAVTTGDDAVVYLCEDYILTVQTVPGGDLQKTVLEVTGFLPEQLSMIRTLQAGAKRYAFVWTAAGETGEQVGRCVILDDGDYHYVLTAMADEANAGSLAQGVWQDIFASFRLIAPEDVVSSGS